MIRPTLILLLALAAYAGAQQWKAHVIRHQTARQQITIEKALASDAPRSVLPLVATLPPLAADASPADQQQRLSLQVRAYTAARDIAPLLAIYQAHPDAILAHQPTSLLLARHFLATSQHRDIAALRTPWCAQPENLPTWLLFDADALLGQGKRDEALALLKSTPLTGSDEALRRVRLALLFANTPDYTAAWNELAAAERADTHNPDVRAFRAQILEAAGKLPLARVEYVAAQLAEPKNPLWRDQLASFYLRTHQLDLAQDTWVQAQAETPLDTIALKTAFWSQVLSPRPKAAVSSSADAASTSIFNPPSSLNSPLGALAAYIRQHPTWSDSETRQLRRIEHLQAQHPEVLWLRVIAALRHADYPQAYELLQHNHHKIASLSAPLENALLRTLAWRLEARLTPPSLKLASETENNQQPTVIPHPFFRALDAAQQAQNTSPLPPDLQRLLESPHAFAAAFLAAGWREAALTLLPQSETALQPVPTAPDLPAWFPYGIAVCLRENRSPQAALDYLATQPPSPELAVLAAENHLALDHPDLARPLLAALATTDSDPGYRAAWLLANLQLIEHHPDQATTTVQNSPALRATTLGQELLATAALTAKNEPEAAAIYQTIAKHSIEARTYLARRAFQTKDYPTAERLTQELLTLMPDQLQLRANLVAILDAKKSQP